MMRVNTRRRGEAGFGLVELVVVILLILLAAGVYFGMFHGKGKKTTPRETMDRAKEVACQENLRQIRMGVRTYTMSGDAPPSTLAGLGFPAESTRCPVSGQPYAYNPRAIGDDVVRCPYHKNL
ncbi:MAG: hypothetical protein ACE5O2_08190 [Armatimonadota bacterium]